MVSRRPVQMNLFDEFFTSKRWVYSHGKSPGVPYDYSYISRNFCPISQRMQGPFGMNCLRSRGRRDRGFEYHPRNGCLVCRVCDFLCSCTGRGLATSWSPVQGILPTALDLVTEVKRKVSWRRPRTKLGRTKGKKFPIWTIAEAVVHKTTPLNQIRTKRIFYCKN
jgi:hypothetical protein